MRHRFSKVDLRVLSSLIAVALLLASVPLSAGVIVVSGPSHPELTINICHPIEASGLVSSTLLARPAVTVPQWVLLVQGSSPPVSAARLVEHRVAPDTPPPKPLA